MDVSCVVAFFCVCVFLCLGRGLATRWSPVQGVLPSVNDQETEKPDLCSKVRAKRKKKTYYRLVDHCHTIYHTARRHSHFTLPL
jgi:hypothetical protein